MLTSSLLTKVLPILCVHRNIRAGYPVASSLVRLFQNTDALYMIEKNGEKIMILFTQVLPNLSPTGSCCF